jgi:hypothetical protein
MKGLRWMAAVAALAIVCVAVPASVSSHPLAGPATAAAKRPGHHKKKSKQKTVSCKVGQARIRAGNRSLCVRNSLPVAHTTPQAAAAAMALRFQPGGRDRRGRRSLSPAKYLGRLQPSTLKKLERTIATGLTMGETLLPGTVEAHAASAGDATARTAIAGLDCGRSAALKEYDDAPPDVKQKAQQDLEDFQKSQNYKGDDIDANADFTTGTIKIGVNAKDKGIRIEVGLRECGGDNLTLDSCPTAQGVVEGHDKKELEFSLKITEHGKLVMQHGFKLTGETTIKAQTGDDGKLDSYDIKHVYELAGTVGGPKQPFGPVTVDYTYIGEAHIDMRSGSQSPPPAVVDVHVSATGVEPAELIAVEIELAHKAQADADKEFSAEVEKTTARLREKEAGWLKPNACASMHFEPASETLKLNKGQTGTFKSTIEANKGGTPPAATWTLSAQQNASFTPTGGSVNPLSTSYSVTNAGKGLVVSTVVKATSKAGVAEGTWKQKTTQALKTITGTFTGRIEWLGSLIEWTGQATFERFEVAGADPEVASVFQLTSGQAEVTASGAFVGADCTQSGKATITLQPLSLWTIEQKNESFKYEIIAPWDPNGMVPVTLSNCNPSYLNGTPAELTLNAAAIQSGHVDTSGDPSKAAAALEQSSPDGFTFVGSASEERLEESYSWSWSFKGSP